MPITMSLFGVLFGGLFSDREEQGCREPRRKDGYAVCRRVFISMRQERKKSMELR